MMKQFAPLHVDPVALTVGVGGGWLGGHEETACREQVGAQAASQGF